ncbi:MAG: hypothetical protein NZ937_04170 [Armatimonadetes bacterium]|nr:hypothetical protein [Armatimonadota bacterium]
MESVSELWQKMKPIIRQRMSFTPDAWRSVDLAVPITIDETTLVLGLSEENEKLRSYLETQTMMALIREILLEITGKEMSVVVIPGTTEDDWKRYKSRQEYLRQLSVRTSAAAARQTTERRDWIWLSNQIVQAYTHLLHRQYEFVKAQFLLDWAPKIAEFAEEFVKANPQKQDEVTRELEKICQKLAGMLNTSGFIIGLEIVKAMRAREKKEQAETN